MSDWRAVKLLRYEDPLGGPRRIPHVDTPMEGKLEVSMDATFSIDPKAGRVTLQENGQKVDIGSQMVYWVQ